MASIELSGLTKHYGEVVALQDVDLTVGEGEIFGFLGPNGAGKATTINMLLDFVRPTDGTATVLGMDAQRDSLAVRRQVGVLRNGELVAVDTIEGLRNAMTTDALLMVTLDRPFEDDVSLLETIAGVTSVTADGSGLAVQCANGAKTGVIDVVEELGYSVQDFRTEEASLEELFMAYTDEDRSGTAAEDADADSEAEAEAATRDTEAEMEVEG